MRHCDAAMHKGSDITRPLTQNGIAQAKRVAEFIKSSPFSPQLFLTSTAQRTQQTAKTITAILPETVSIEKDEELYNGQFEIMDWFKFQANDAFDTIALVGHIPDVLSLIYELTGEEMRFFSQGETKLIQIEILSWKELKSQSGKIVSSFIPESE